MSGTAADLFFWNDWQGDPCLRLCSLAAQGLWMRLLCIAAESTKKGYVLVNGEKPNVAQIARMCGCGKEEAFVLCKELQSNGVFDRDKDQVIFSRRMVKKEQHRKNSSKGGKKGGKTTFQKKTGIYTQDRTQEFTQDRTQHPIPLPKPVPKPRARKKDSSATPASQAPAAPSLPGQFFIELPTNKFATGNETWGITPEGVAEFQALYPAADVEQALREMKGWLVSHPALRKTHGGMMRFVNSWLAREQNKGGRGVQSVSPHQRTSFPERNGEIIKLFPDKDDEEKKKA